MAMRDGDVRVAVGLAGNALVGELVLMLCKKDLLSDDEALVIITGAIDSLGRMGDAQPHPAWIAAQYLLRLQAQTYGGPGPGTKPS